SRVRLGILALSDVIEDRLKIGRQRRFEFHLSLSGWMRERQPCGVQEWALEALHGPEVVRDAAVDAAVGRIADDRVADGAQVHADLVRAPGCDGDAKQRHPFQVLRLGDARDSASRPPGPRRHLLAVRGIASDWLIDAPPLL